MFDLNDDPGAGNLNLRAYVASLVGPRRIAHGRRMIKQLTGDQTTPMLGAVSGKECMYFEVWLPQSSIAAIAGNAAFVAFSSSENCGQDAFQILLSGTQRYSGVLLPDDELYAQAIADAAFGPLANLSVVISSVVF